MDEGAGGAFIGPVEVRDPAVLGLLDQLTSELAEAGYTADQTFGYTAEQLERSGVHLVGARVGDRLVGIAGIELDGGGTGELRRFFVAPEHRGTGVADALLDALTAWSSARGVHVLLLQAARTFYRRHGFVETARFGPYVHSATSVCMRRDGASRP